MSPGTEKQINEQIAMNLPPENILRHMSPEDRAKYGKAGLTAEESQRVYTDGEEKELQRHCVALLNQRGVTFVVRAPMFKKSMMTPGTPDLIFCWQGKPCAVECKTLHGRLSPDQDKCWDLMVTERWNYAVVRSLREFQQFLDDLT
tara:strand:+ start:389 stop:826 length:438 start_codon:yes stop_codon:yes gene_type:complete